MIHYKTSNVLFIRDSQWVGCVKCWQQEALLASFELQFIFPQLLDIETMV